MIDFQIDQLGYLPLGSELKDQDVQALVDVNVGDNWDEALKEKQLS